MNDGDNIPTDAQTTANDILTIHRLIDLTCFTTNETLITARMRAEEAIERIEIALRVCGREGHK